MGNPTSLAIAAGDTMNMHSLIGPNCIAGTGIMYMSAQIHGDTSANAVIKLTYIANVTSTCTPVSGINGLNESQIVVYPNPASNLLTITGFEPNHSMQIQLFDVLGNMIYTEKQSAVQSLQLNVNSLTQGLYFVKVLDTETNSASVHKFTKL
jgi:hypothetical protein